jgi:asparagine synthetase B (glutamine-hydrolysing)
LTGSLGTAGRTVEPREAFLTVSPGQPELFLIDDHGRWSWFVDPWAGLRSSARQPEVHKAALSDSLAYALRPAATSASLLRGVVRVPPWSRAVACHGSAVVVDDIRVPTASERFESTETSARRLHQAILQATAELVGDAEAVGVLCTGGLDSAIVAAAATAVLGKPPILLTATGGLVTGGELQRLRRLIDALAAPTLRIEGPFPFDVELLRKLNSGSAWPIGGIFSSVWDRVAKECVGVGIEVVLTGEGGNEIFSPAGAEVYDFRSAGRLGDALRGLGAWRQAPGPALRSALRRGRWSPRILPAKVWAAGDASGAAGRWYGRSHEDVAEVESRWQLRLDEMQARGFSATEAVSLLRLEGLEEAGPIDTPGIRFRHPLANAEVRRAFFKVPIENRYGSGWHSVGDKHLLRLVGQMLLPAAVVGGPKIGPANQISNLVSDGWPEQLPAWTESAAGWLGVNCDDAFLAPALLPASLGLDWTQLLALLAWADNANCRTSL